MCGIAGIIDLSAGRSLAGLVQRMADKLVRRGPDGSGVWADEEAGIALGHRRLKVIDLTPTGRQPMHSACGRFVISYNGEIYNHPGLRKELQDLGRSFRGTSDTEVLLSGIAEWGLEKALRKSVGMFAFALWDRKDRSLQLVRDRLGEKPLYYGWQGSAFLFGSELKALRAHPAATGEINRDALALFMRFGYIPTPYSIYQDIYKLPPGSVLTLNNTAVKPVSFSPFPADNLQIQTTCPVPYWSFGSVVEDGTASPFTGTDAEAVDRLGVLLKESVKQQMIADVPLGAFLSGGVDSSTIVALMQEQSERRVKTFTIGFHDSWGYNEAEDARAVAKHLGTEHTELYVSSEEAWSVIPRLPGLYDEPFADSSQMPTLLISELTRQHVTVSLSGDGGDELFAGYNRHFLGPGIREKYGRLPKAARTVLANGLTMISPLNWDRLISSLDRVLPRSRQYSMPGDRLHKFAGMLRADSRQDMYLGLVSHWPRPESLVIDGKEGATALSSQENWGKANDFARQMMCLDTMMYLPDDILVKVDRAAMGVSLETRVPLLDHRLVEFAWRLPLSMQIRNGQGKWLLRQLLSRYVPKEMVARPKAGFHVPIDAWLRGPLRDWAGDLLSERRLRQDGYLRPGPVIDRWQEHLSEKWNRQHSLWCVLMFQAWLDEWEKK